MTTCLGNCCSPGCRLWCLWWCLFVLSFFPRDVLDEILNLIESVSEGFPSYSFIWHLKHLFAIGWTSLSFICTPDKHNFHKFGQFPHFAPVFILNSRVSHIVCFVFLLFLIQLICISSDLFALIFLLTMAILSWCISLSTVHFNCLDEML